MSDLKFQVSTKDASPIERFFDDPTNIILLGILIAVVVVAVLMLKRKG